MIAYHGITVKSDLLGSLYLFLCLTFLHKGDKILRCTIYITYLCHNSFLRILVYTDSSSCLLVVYMFHRFDTGSWARTHLIEKKNSATGHPNLYFIEGKHLLRFVTDKETLVEARESDNLLWKDKL